MRQEKVELRIALLEYGVPLAGYPYHLRTDDSRFAGELPKTSDDGMAVIRIPANIYRATLIVGAEVGEDYDEDADIDEYELVIGYVNPITNDGGPAVRLINLDLLEDGDDDGIEEAMETFLTQVEEGSSNRENQLARLEQEYGS